MTNPAASSRPGHKRYFFEKFGITERLLERCLGEALTRGGDYADLYFESVTATSLGVDEQIVKSASQGTSAGCGIRVLSGERTGYAYTDNLNPDRLLHAARTAALIASGPAKQTVQGFVEAPAADLYPVPLGGFDLDLAARLELILRADRAARAHDPRIVQVRAGYSEELRRKRYSAPLPVERFCDRQRRRPDDQRLGGRRRQSRPGTIRRRQKT
jgi:TldD protein